MAKRYSNNLITEINEMLDKKVGNLKESIGWQQEGPGGPAYFPEDNEPGFDAGPDLGMQAEPETEPQQSVPADPEVTQLINQIRQLALQGIAKLANNPTSIQYDALKKVWQIIDKTVEIKDDKKGV